MSVCPYATKSLKRANALTPEEWERETAKIAKGADGAGRKVTTVPVVEMQRHMTDDEILRARGVTGKITALMKHAVYFTDETGHFTITSMVNGFRAIGHKHPEMSAGMVFGGIIASLGLNPHVRDVHKMVHESATGIFTATGELNRKEINKMCKFAKHDGAFTDEDFAEMRQANLQQSQNSNSASKCALVHLFSDYIGALQSKAEFGAFLDNLSDCTREGKPAMSTKKFKALFLNGSEIFREAEARQKALKSKID